MELSSQKICNPFDNLADYLDMSDLLPASVTDILFKGPLEGNSD